MSWIHYNTHRPHYGELIYCEYQDENDHLHYSYKIYTVACETLNIQRWQKKHLVPTIYHIPAN